MQEEIIRDVLAGKDALTLLPTGAGKSRTYQLPSLIRPGLTLVISPLIALIRDQVEKLREVPGMTRVAALVSGMDASSQEEVLRQAASGRLSNWSCLCILLGSITYCSAGVDPDRIQGHRLAEQGRDGLSVADRR